MTTHAHTHHEPRIATRLLARLGLLLVEGVSRPVVVRGGGRRSGRRGVALLLVLTYVAIMTAVVVSFFYNSQVSFMVSSNIRDELKAYYKARTAMNLARLMVAYQYELEKDEFFGPRMQKSNFQMYQIVDMLMEPFQTGAVGVEVPGENTTLASYDLAESGATGLGNETGDYTVRVQPEEGRININRFHQGVDQVALFDLCMLFAPESYDALFDPNDSSGLRDERKEVVAAIMDWVDQDGERSSISNACAVEGSGGDEDGRYSGGERKYESKNAKFTSLDELFLVHGVGDDFMETFADSLTVYPVDRVNVNLATARVMYAIVCNAAQLSDFEEQVWACADPTVGTNLFILAAALEGYQQFVSNPLNLLHLYTVQGELSVIPGVTPNGTVVPFRNQREFREVMRALQTDPMLVQRFLMYSPTAFQLFGEQLLMMDPTALGLSQYEFDDRKIFGSITTQSPRIFRITAAGEYNGTRKTLTAVVDFNDPAGKFLYWREY